MESERDVLQRNLSKAETSEQIKEVQENAQDYGHQDIVALAEAKLKALESRVQADETIPPAQVSQITEMGGNPAVAEERTDAVDAKSDAVEAGAEEQIKAVEAAGTPAVERPPIPPLPEKRAEAKTEKTAEELEVERLRAKLDEKKKGIYDKYRGEWNNLLTQNDTYQQAHGFIKSPEGVKEVRNFKSNIATLENQLAPYLNLDFHYAKTPDTGVIILDSQDPSLKSEDKYKIGMSISNLVNQPEYKRMLEMTSDISDRGKVLKLKDLFAQMLEKSNFWLNAASESEKGEGYVKERSAKVQKDLSDLEAKRDKELADIQKAA